MATTQITAQTFNSLPGLVLDDRWWTGQMVINNCPGFTVNDCEGRGETGGNCLRIAGTSTNGTISNSFFHDARNRALPGATGHGIMMRDDCNGVLVVDCEMYDNAEDGVQHWNTMLSTARVTYRRCKFYNNSENGFDGKAGNATFEDCEFYGNGTAVNATATTGGGTEQLVVQSGDGTGRFRNLILRRCTFYQPSYTNDSSCLTLGSTLGSSTIEDCTFDARPGPNTPVKVRDGHTTSITRCGFFASQTDSTKALIRVTNSSPTTVTASTFTKTSTANWWHVNGTNFAKALPFSSAFLSVTSSTEGAAAPEIVLAVGHGSFAVDGKEVSLVSPTSGAAFPQWISTTPSEEALNTTTHDIDMPAAADGDHLILLFGLHADESGVAVPGFTAITNAYAANGGCSLAAYYREADGTEGATIQATSVASARSLHQVLRYAKDTWQGTPEAPAFAASLGSRFPDPPALTPSWGSGRTAWIAAMVSQRGLTIIDTPDGYTGLVEDNTALLGDTIELTIASVRRELEAASDNPTTFEVSGTQNVRWAAGTIALRGAVIAGEIILAVGHGSFALTGQDAGTAVGEVVMAVGHGSFALTGQDATTLADIAMAAGAGSFALTGQVVLMSPPYVTVAGAGSFALTGQDVATLATIWLTVEHGTFNLTWPSIVLSSPGFTAEPAIVGLEGQAVATVVAFADGDGRQAEFTGSTNNSGAIYVGVTFAVED